MLVADESVIDNEFKMIGLETLVCSIPLLMDHLVESLSPLPGFRVGGRVATAGRFYFPFKLQLA